MKSLRTANIAALLVILCITVAAQDNESCTPSQIHLSLAASNSTQDQTLRYDAMRVSWVTQSACTNSTLEFQSYDSLLTSGSNNLNGVVLENSTVSTTKQISMDTDTRTSFLHYADTGSLQVPHVPYVYQLRYSMTQEVTATTALYKFVSPNVDDNDEVARIVFYADMGNSWQGSMTVQSMVTRTAEEPIDVIMHIGDFAYDLSTDDSTGAAIFFEQVEPILTKVPMQGIPGNHEVGESWVQFTERILPPQMEDVERVFYSYKVKNVYMITLVTQWYVPYDEDLATIQDNWLEDELTTAESDPTIDFIIVNAHRPAYCSQNIDVCNQNAVFIRSLIEDKMYNHKVDFYMCGHLHNYERSFPVYQEEVMQGPNSSVSQHEYINPLAPTYILSGSPGNQEYMPSEPYPSRDYSAKVLTGINYSQLTVYNNTHAYFEQIDSLNEETIDYLWLIKGVDFNASDVDSTGEEEAITKQNSLRGSNISTVTIQDDELMQ